MPQLFEFFNFLLATIIFVFHSCASSFLQYHDLVSNYHEICLISLIYSRGLSIADNSVRYNGHLRTHLRLSKGGLSLVCIKCGAEVPDMKYCGACGWNQEKPVTTRTKRGNGQGRVWKRGKTWSAQVTLYTTTELREDGTTE